MAYRGKFAKVACGLSTAGHHVRLVGPVGSDSMGDQLVAELEQCGVDIEYSFRAGAASPRTLILLDETGERTIIAVNSEAGPSSFLPVRGPDLRSADCVYIEGYTRYPAGTAAAAKSAFLVTSPPRTRRDNVACDRGGRITDAIRPYHLGGDV
jgi:sugar/nucleoside kinase (ribokinase family)